MEETEISELLVDVMAEVYLAQPEDPRKFMADRIYTQLGLPILDPDNNHHAQIKRLQTDLEKNVKKVMEMLQEHQALKDEFAQREAELEEKNFELKKDLIYYKQLELANRANKVEAAKNISQRNVYLPKKKMLIDLPDQREDIRKKPKSPIRILNLSEPSSEDEELSKPIERKIVVEAKEVPKSTNIEITQDEEMDLDYDLMNHEALPSIQVEDDDLMDEAMMILKTDSVPEHLMELEKQLDNFCKKIIGRLFYEL